MRPVSLLGHIHRNPIQSDADKAVPEATKDALSVIKASQGHIKARSKHYPVKLPTFSWDKGTQK